MSAVQPVFVARPHTTNTRLQVDADGLPLVYDRRRIQSFWDARPGELQVCTRVLARVRAAIVVGAPRSLSTPLNDAHPRRHSTQAHWTTFLSVNVPFLTKLASIVISSGPGALVERDGELARDAREIMERLGPTYIKVGQMMSVRPDVVGPRAMAELQKLQDAVPRFPTAAAVATIEEELGAPVSSVFQSISPEPVAAASLAQVYKATLLTGEVVAVKVQRPGIRGVVSKDLYVLRRAAEVYNGLMQRLVPQQRTDYVALLNEWAIGFYTELDFKNEARNAMQMRASLERAGVSGVLVPRVFSEFSTRKLLVTEWVDGVKLTDCSPEQIKELTATAQEAFLTQLLTLGFFHADPHPGNLLALKDTSTGYKLALLDFGLIARLSQTDMDALLSSLVHLANKDWANLVDDFIQLKVLPPDTPRARVEVLMAKVLGPYVATGGGAKAAFETYGGLGGVQSLTQDLVGALSEVPFSLPPYFALLGRAVAVLEGTALQGDPSYRIVMSSFPFVSRKLLADDAPALQRALSEILYAPGPNSNGLRGQRLLFLLSAAMGMQADGTASGAFIDLDTAPEGGIPPADMLRLVLSPASASLRQGVLFNEMCSATELLTRQVLRRTLRPWVAAAEALTLPSLPFLPPPPPLRVPVLLPGEAVLPRAWVAPEALLDALAPKLSQSEEVYAQSLADAASAVLGTDVERLLSADTWMPVTLAPGPAILPGVTLPVPTLAPLPVSGEKAVALASRAAREFGITLPLGEALQSAARSLAPASSPASDELAAAMADLSEAEALVLRDTLDRVRAHIWGRITDRLAALTSDSSSAPAGGATLAQ